MPTFTESLSARGISAPYSGPLLPTWKRIREYARAGLLATPGRIAFVGDSKTRGVGAGTANSSNVKMNGAYNKNRPYRTAQILALGGVPMTLNTWFGGGGAATVADILGYDTRLSGFTGWGGSASSLGGGTLNSGNTNPGNFTPDAPINRLSVFFQSRSGGGTTFSVTKGSETFNSPAGTDPTGQLVRAEFAFVTKDAAQIAITRTGGANLNLVGLVAWDSANPGIEVANLGISGAVSGQQADTTAYQSPGNALRVYAPHLTVFNLGTNDLPQNVPLATYIANMTYLIQQAQLSGDVIIQWPSIGGVDGTFGSDANRAIWKTALRDLASKFGVSNTSNPYGCIFVDEESLLGGRLAAQAAGYFDETPFGVHENGAGYYAEGAALGQLLLTV